LPSILYEDVEGPCRHISAGFFLLHKRALSSKI
jgi:hypothetical protein